MPRLAAARRRARLSAFAVAALASLFLVAFVAPAARAEDEEEWSDPSFTAEDLALVDESLPAGWKSVPEGDGARTVAVTGVRALVVEAAKEAGVPEGDRGDLPQAFRSADGALVAAVLVNVHVEPSKFRAALAPRAQKAGVALREMASPARLLLLSGPKERLEEVAEFHRKGSARLLASRAVVAVTEEQLPEHGANLAAASLALEPGAPTARMARALVLAGEASDASARAKAVEELEAALAAGGEPPLDATVRALGSGMLGSLLLQKKDPAADAKGRDALAAAVSKPGDLSKGRLAQFRYDLACAHARLGAKDEAFAHLEQTLEADRASPIVGIQHWREDPDFASLKEDPRWKALLEKFPKADAPARE